MRLRFHLLLLLILASTGRAETILSAEDAMGGRENLQKVLTAEVVSFERISVPPVTRVTRSKDGQMKFEELIVNNWDWGMILSVDGGPIPVPAAIAGRMRKLLASAEVLPDSALAISYQPSHRFVLKEAGHTLEIFVLRWVGSWEVYRDGVCIGGHGGDSRIIADLEALLPPAAAKCSGGPTTEPPLKPTPVQ